jgi:membrane-bound ClpP family serine protease
MTALIDKPVTNVVTEVEQEKEIINNAGSSLEDFFRQEGNYEEIYNQAVKEVLAYQIEQAMKEQGITKVAMSEKMHTSRAALDRLLNPANTSVTLQTLEKAAGILGKKLLISLV